MAKVHKIEVYLIDANGGYDEFGKKALKDFVEESLEIKLDVTTKVTAVQSSEEFEWDDDLEINKIRATKEDYDTYLKETGK